MNGSSKRVTRPAASPAAAGFRPAGVALAVAAAFFSTTDRVQAQPSGAQVIHGQASLSQQGNNLLVTTQNGAGTAHSAINWRSFSVPAGSTTHFQQPGAASLSVNRVVGNDPSALFGTLSSNGRLVLVNPAGIAVGAGAVVDTAGFTASTLRMSDADALAGRLVFGGDALASGALSVGGKIVARSGDVVLIAPHVQVGSQALVQSPNGATVLAAGQKVELTGRGLEGIRLELQAPGDQALNLGTLQGDAVGIFAGQLRHSGLIQATGIGTEVGKVVLKGLDTADISGRVAATQGGKGGQVHATANKVTLRSGAVIDVSGERGGGEALVGGGWQGNDSRISNAVETLVESGATIKADASAEGNGGTIVAWSDGSTRVYGALSARGGEVSGNGGNIETSGHYLDMQGQVDTRAPNGNMGNLLLDPTNIYIAISQTSAAAAGMVGSDQTSTGPNFTVTLAVQDSLVTTGSIETFLASNNVMVQTTNALGSGAGFIKVVDSLTWSSANQLTLSADADIAVNAPISSKGTGVLSLRAQGNITQAGAGTISANRLAIKALGNVALDTAPNMVNNLAASIGDATNTNRVFSFRNGGALNVDAGIDGISGIHIQASGGGYDPLSPDAYISLISGGALTQSAGALIDAKAIYAQGSRVALTEGNFTGVIAGKATGAATGDTFKYRSINGIDVNNVGTGSGIQNAGGPDAIAIELTGTDVSQRAGSTITAAGGLRLVTTGPVNLFDSGNNVSALTAVGVGSLNYQNAGALAVGIGGAGVSAMGSVDIRSADALTVQSSVSGNGVILKANGADKDLNINSVVDSGSSSMDLVAANDILLSNATLNGGGVGILSAGNAAKVTAGTSTLSTSLSGSTLDVQGTLVIGSPVIVDSMSLVSGGSVTGAGDLTIGSNLFWSGGRMTGSGDTVIAPGATASITGPVSLMRPLVNASGGTIVLSGSGQISAMSPGFLDNAGAFDIQSDGGFTGSAFTINNSGMFGKTAGTGVSMLDGVNFTNTGMLGVASGTLQFGSAGFSSNPGVVALAPGATLDNGNTTLANTSAGVIKGAGTLRLGTGTLNNNGALMPGGPAAVGTLTIDAATVNLDAGTHIYADLVDTANFDRVHVTGNVNLASGVTVVLDTAAATGLLPGDSFDILQSSQGSVGGTLPVVSAFDTTFQTSPAPALRVALPPLPPAPAPSSGSTVDRIAELIDGDYALATQVMAELDTNPLTTFSTLLQKEEEKGKEETQGLDDLVDNNQCKR